MASIARSMWSELASVEELSQIKSGLWLATSIGSLKRRRGAILCLSQRLSPLPLFLLLLGLGFFPGLIVRLLFLFQLSKEPLRSHNVFFFQI